MLSGDVLSGGGGGGVVLSRGVCVCCLGVCCPGRGMLSRKGCSVRGGGGGCAV